MTRSEAVKSFIIKSVLPVAAALLLYCIFKSACMKGGELDYVWLWILCGLPFGLHRMCLWIVPGGAPLGGGITLFTLNFIISGVIGGFVLIWRLIVAAWYVPRYRCCEWQRCYKAAINIEKQGAQSRFTRNCAPYTWIMRTPYRSTFD